MADYVGAYTGAQIDAGIAAGLHIADKSAVLTAAGWTGDAAPYTQTVSVAGILSADKPIIDIVQSGTQETAKAELGEWPLVSKIDTADGSITATCYSDKPTHDLTIAIKVV